MFLESVRPERKKWKQSPVPAVCLIIPSVIQVNDITWLPVAASTMTHPKRMIELSSLNQKIFPPAMAVDTNTQVKATTWARTAVLPTKNKNVIKDSVF